MIAPLIVASALALASCSGRSEADINRPLAQSQIQSESSFDSIFIVISEYSKENRFAIQPITATNIGQTDFTIRLYRDDISIIITRVKDGSIDIFAYPLCACEIDRRAGLQIAADDSVAGLNKALAQLR